MSRCPGDMILPHDFGWSDGPFELVVILEFEDPGISLTTASFRLFD